MILPRSTYLVCSQEPWGQRVTWPTQSDEDWRVITSPSELDAALLWGPSPRAIFVLHWHSKLKPWVVQHLRCIGFHASDLPEFRGGNPIGNQQSRGVWGSQLTAFRLDEGLDTGPILMKMPLDLRGTREDVLDRIAGLVAQMIPAILHDDPPEVPQTGPGSFYTRAQAV